jgi:NAD(P)-dependent dehydrogenase (short-subunit alcohol dehydrogenase family)
MEPYIRCWRVSLDRKAYIITGPTSGIGYATALDGLLHVGELFAISANRDDRAVLGELELRRRAAA